MSKKRILIIDDDPAMTKLIRLILIGTDKYIVRELNNASDGLDTVKEFTPDLILLDFLMPEIDGNKLLKQIRATDYGKDIPCIIVTARGKTRDYFELIGANGFLEKPFEPDELLAKIAEIFSDLDTSSGGKASGKKILILEDDDDVASPMKSAFADYGYAFKTATTPAQCLELAPQWMPDIIVMKFILAGMNANQLITLLKGMGKVTAIPVLVYSDIVLGSEKEMLLSAGAAGFIQDSSAVRILREINDLFSKLSE